MTRPWETLDSAETPEGRLELKKRGEGELVITIGGRVLMNSALHRTEAAAAEAACRPVAGRIRPRVLIGGLGMGYTLRAALDALPKKSSVTVAEIDPTIVRWCRGPLAGLTGNAVGDPRVSVLIQDVAAVIADAADTAKAGGLARFDAIVLDLYEGPRNPAQAKNDPFYGRAALERTRDALTPDGLLTVWSEDAADSAFKKRLRDAGFQVELTRPGHGGPRHVVYVARSAAIRGSKSLAAGIKPDRK